MLSLTRKADYALVVLADLARRGDSIASARELSQSTQVPLPVLTNILHQLLRCGLVVSVMGSKGGYSLARSADEISLAEIIDAIEGPFRLVACCGNMEEGDDGFCELVDDCRIREPVRRVHERVRDFLDAVTLAYVASDTVTLGTVTRTRGTGVGDTAGVLHGNRSVLAPDHDQMQA